MEEERLVTKYKKIFLLKPSGDLLVRVQVPDPKRPKKYIGTQHRMPKTAESFNTRLEAALKMRQRMEADIDRIARGAVALDESLLFETFGVKEIQRRIASLTVTSPKTVRRYWDEMRHILAYWGDRAMTGITREDVQLWKALLGMHIRLRMQNGEARDCAICKEGIKKVGKKNWACPLGLSIAPPEGLKPVFGHGYTPEFINGWVRLFKSIMVEYSLQAKTFNAAAGLSQFNPKMVPTYTDEEPNTLFAPEIQNFLEATYRLERGHFAQVMLGMLTGRRHCELRTLRYKGPTPDIIWETGEIKIRRSNSEGDQVQDWTKTFQDVTVYMPQVVMDVLRSHVANLAVEQKKSDLLFPPLRRRKSTKTEFFQSKSALAKPIAKICADLKIKKHLTPKGISRRTYQKLCKKAEVDTLMQQVICGHTTEEMTNKYTAIDAPEKLAAMTKMAAFAGIEKAANLAPVVKVKQVRAKRRTNVVEVEMSQAA